MDPRQVQDLAKQLAAGPGAQHCRSAVSRAYYAAFNVAVDLIEHLETTQKVGFRVPGLDRKHQFYAFVLRQPQDLDLEKAGELLESLRRDRNVAEYDCWGSRFETPRTVATQILHAETVIQKLDAYGAQPNQQRLAAAVKMPNASRSF